MVVPLLKNTLPKGHLSNTDRITWQEDLWISLILTLTKGPSLIRTELFGSKTYEYLESSLFPKDPSLIGTELFGSKAYEYL